jgi:hypothetical protein
MSVLTGRAMGNALSLQELTVMSAPLQSPTQREQLSRTEIIVYGALLLLNVVLKFAGNSLAWGALCSGTGTGQNRATLRLCQDERAFIYPFVLDIGVLLVVLVFYRVTKMRRRFRVLVTAMFALYIFFTSLWIWYLDFFVERVR